ncbi:hypothetical protein [Psychroserpens ponticola]|uniref:DUF4239 domain-containing protein n=1 Tax=Psychroserpens ponticola TaxID=2932268 RepID=A0ABY7RTE1_9FLAO|nr:hypothetical protein [Psychroserpens ponticola]WCO00243.1 hypothetical protein MUN68_009165 [Psychroserpens ponticola]
MLKEILTNPFYAIIGVLAIWQILNLILIGNSKLTEKTWARLEYIWIIIGFMGVISIIIENNRNYKKGDLTFTENWIENQFESLLSFAERETVCFKFNKSDWMPEEEFNKRQAESDRICNWVKEEILPILEKSKENGFEKIGEYKKLELEELKGNYTPDRITRDIKEINEDILVRDNLINEIRSNYWLGFQYSIGVVMLIFAFALRLTLVTKKVKLK